MDSKIGKLSVEQVQMVKAISRREVAAHFEYLKANFSGSHGEINPSEEKKIEFGPLAHISVDELTDADLLMWNRAQAYKKGRGVITPEDLVRYRTDVKMNRNLSRTTLAASIAEIVTDVPIERANKKDAKK